MQDIAEALGLSRTAVYYYFKNKDAILRALTEEVLNTRASWRATPWRAPTWIRSRRWAPW